MGSSWKTGFAFIIVGYFVGCAPVNFSKVPAAPCGSEGVACVTKCTGPDCINTYSVERRVGQGLVDVLIIDDNSGSMSTEQRAMAAHFPTYFSSLGDLDYRVAITTTDISTAYSTTPANFPNKPGPYNGNGALQDGNLIDFGSAGKYLDRNTPNRDALFFQTIQRPETLACEQSGFTQCPSDDERGIFAANLVLDRTANQFMRPTAHLAIIILSDEDERSLSDPRSDLNSSDAQLRGLYPLETNDLPDTLISKFHTNFPGKTLSVHPIIVRPGDKNCLKTQSSQANFVRGVEGYSYDALQKKVGGTEGSICDSDFSSILTNIATKIQSQVTSLPFSCRPINDQFTVTFDPKPAQDIHVTADFANMVLNVNDPVPALTNIKLEYQCVK